MFLTKSNITYISHLSGKFFAALTKTVLRKFACENESVCKTGQRALGSCFDAYMNQHSSEHLFKYPLHHTVVD